MDLSVYKDVNSRDKRLRKDLVITVALSGGGLRAANLATGVLLALEQIRHEKKLRLNLLQEIDYFSTVSGGGFAVGAYLSTLFDYLSYPQNDLSGFNYAAAFEKPPASCQEDETLAKDTPKRNLERGYTSSLVNGLFELKAIFTAYDRGVYLEERLDKKVLGADCRSLKGPEHATLRLSDIFIRKEMPEREFRLPYWVANATIYQNGELFQFAPDVLKSYEIVQYSHRLKKYKQSNHDETLCAKANKYGVPPVFEDCMPLSVGLKASATFPAAIPATTFLSTRCNTAETNQKECYIQLLDGGLFDNLGMFSALDIIRQHRLLYEQTVANPVHHLLIVIDAFPGEIVPFSKRKGSPTWFQVLLRQLEVTKDSLRNYMKSEAQLHQDYKKAAANPRHDSQNGAKNLERSTLFPPDLEVIFLDIDDLPYAKEVDTNVNIKKGEQKKLIAAGRDLVKRRKWDLIDFLNRLPDLDITSD